MRRYDGHEHALGSPCQASPVSVPPVMKIGRGAHNAINSWRESTGMSFQPKGPEYFDEIAGHPVRFTGTGDVFHGHQHLPVAAARVLRPPSPEELTYAMARRGS